MNACFRAVVAFLFLLSASTLQAGYIVLGNLPATNDASGTAVDAGIANGGQNPESIRPAFSFTMPSQAYPLQHVALRFREYNTAAGDAVQVGLYLDNGSDLPGPLVGNPLISPPSVSNAADQFNFVPAAPLTLAASTKYWLVISATSGRFVWAGSAPSITPTSQVGAAFGKHITFIGDTPRDSNFGVRNFEIVTTVPEPSSWVAILGVLFSISVVRQEFYLRRYDLVSEVESQVEVYRRARRIE